ncbi:MAG TPA: hypothetical protein VF637_17925 [Sphingomicrobium sp.]
MVKPLGGLLLASAPIAQATAQQMWRDGIITGIHLTDGGNYAFRLKLAKDGTDQFADCVDTMAYMNTDHSNYAAIAAALMTSYTVRRPVVVVLLKQTSGFCQILYIAS